MWALGSGLCAIRLALVCVLCVLAWGCGSMTASGFGDGGPKDAGSDTTMTTVDTGADVPRVGIVDGTGGGEACVGLQCQQTCATTSISGKVFDPAGLVPLYNVYVYIPNAPLDPIPSGPVCKACQAPASGNPIASATTLADGTFTIPNAPSGANIPVVLQLGKWRRHLTIPSVPSCSKTEPADGFFRLPRKQKETSPDDNIPLIALTTGCDGAECFLNGRIGIDISEFTDATGSGRVHVYQGNAASQSFPAGQGMAEELWGNATELDQYDILFDACECEAYNRGAMGYTNFLNYLDMGGRAFTTHYFYNFFADTAECGAYGGFCGGIPPLPTVGMWEGNKHLAFAPMSDCPKSGSYGTSCLTIDTAIPKGVSFAQWYEANNSMLSTGGGEAYGYVGLTDIRDDMGTLDPTLLAAGTVTPWLYAGDVTTGAYDAYYFSINTPVGTDSTTQCERAIFSDVHLSDAPGVAFPGYCPMNPNASTHASNELALEFLFFDLSSCVQNDTQPPPPPPH
jgi:hypothetical protein